MRLFIGFVDKVRGELNRVGADGAPQVTSALHAAYEFNKIIVGVGREEFGNNWVTNTALKAAVGVTNTVAKVADVIEQRKQKGRQLRPEQLTELGAFLSEELAKGNIPVVNWSLLEESNKAPVSAADVFRASKEQNPQRGR